MSCNTVCSVVRRIVVAIASIEPVWRECRFIAAGELYSSRNPIAASYCRSACELDVNYLFVYIKRHSPHEKFVMSASELNTDSFDLCERHAHFNEDGSVTLIDASTLWSLAPDDMNAQFGRLLVSSFTFSENWATWEMHPDGDELVYLMSGEVTLILRLPQGDKRVALIPNRAHVIPKAIWHTAHTNAPCQMLFVTCGRDTQIVSVAEMAQMP